MAFDIVPISPYAPLSENEDVYDIDLSQPERLEPVPFNQLVMDIPNLKTPYQGYAGALNRAALSVTPEKGLLVVLRPYLGMQEFDFVEVFFGDPVIPVDSVVISDIQAANGLAIALYVPPVWLNYGAVDNVFFKVTRVGGGYEESSKIKVFIDNELPAGPNPSIATPYHDYVDKPIFEQRILVNGIRPDDLVTGVKVTINNYPNRSGLSPNYKRKARDQIILRLNGHIQRHTVTENEAAGDAPIVMTLYAGFLSQLGDGGVIAEYTVYDEANNVMDSQSPIQMLMSFVGGGPLPLDAPFVYELDNHGNLDVDLLEGRNATIGVYIRNKDYKVGDTLIITMQGVAYDGVITKTEYRYDVNSIFLDAQVVLPNAHLVGLVKGTLRLSYHRVRTGVTPDRPSDICILEVIGKGTPVGLAPAIILQAPDGNLPADVVAATFVIVPYPGQDSLDAVYLHLIGTYANGTAYYRRIGPRPAGTGNVIFNVINGPEGEIAGLEGGDLQFHYTVVNDQGSRKSQDAKVDVGDLVATLRVVHIEEAPAPNYIFDPSKSLFGASIIVRANPLFTLGSTVTLYFVGKAPGGSTTIPHRITQAWENTDLYFDVARYVVLQNLDRSATIYYTLTKPNERTRLSHAVEMRVGAAIQLSAPGVLESTVIVPGVSVSVFPLHFVNPPVGTIRVTYNMQNTDQIQPYIKGKMGLGSPPIPAKLGNAALGYVDFELRNPVIAAHLGETFTIDYEVKRGNSILPSDPLTVQVEPLPDSVINVVTIPEAHAGQVDANVNNTVQVLAYTFMTTGQPVWIIFEHDDGTPDYVLRNGDPLTPAESSAKKIVHIIPGTYLRSRPNGSQIRVKTLVSMDGFGDRNTAVQLGKPSYSIKKQAGVITHVEVGGAPVRLVVSPDGSRVYVTNEGSHSVSVISTATHKVIHTITGLSRPYAMAISPNGGILYVSNFGTKQVTVINTTSYAFINQIAGFAIPYALALNTLGTRLYVTCNTSHALYTHDTSSGARLYTLGYTNASSVTLNPSNSRIYVAANTRVYTVDQPSNTAVGSLAGFSISRDMAYSPHNVSAKPTLYVANTSAHNIKIMNTGTNVIRNTLTGFSIPYSIVMHPTQPFAYVADYGNNSLKIINTDEETVIDAVEGLNGPTAVAISPDGSTLYVANHLGNSVTVIST